MTVAGLAPDRIAKLAVCFDLFEEALLDEGLDHLVGSTALEALGQGECKAVGRAARRR